MNVLFFLTPKANCTYIYDDFTIRQSLERIEQNRFATIPILKRDGTYVGTISEGDLLWAIKNHYMMNMRDAEGHPVMEVARRKDYLPVKVNTSTQELLGMAAEQNFVPLVDDRNAFIGIVTRQKLMRYCLEEYFQQKELTPKPQSV
jgi:predicted transcriptional regulator